MLVVKKIPDFLEPPLKLTYFTDILLQRFDYDFCKVGMAIVNFTEMKCSTLTRGISTQRMSQQLVKAKRLFTKKVNMLLSNESIQEKRHWPRSSNLLKSGYIEDHNITKKCRCRECIVLSLNKRVVWKQVSKNVARLDKCMKGYIKPEDRNVPCVIPTLTLLCIAVVDRYELVTFLELAKPKAT